MMKLYYSPGACSLSPHIALREAGIAFEAEKVDLGSKKTESGADFKAINPKGYVPALKLDDGQVLTEGPAIVQYIADLKPGSKLAPASGTPARYRLQEWLNYITSELHKSVGSLFNSKMPKEWQDQVKEGIAGRFDFLSKQLEGKTFLTGDTFTVADGYLYTILTWTSHLGIDLAKWPVLKAYVERVAQRPAVQAALKAEGLAA
jgi:glutathione S-transferase